MKLRPAGCVAQGPKGGARRSWRTGWGGFTLIELLVVLAIIAILAALLLPVLARAKAHAQKAECLSNQHQLAVAFRLYAEENEDVVPREGAHLGGEVHLNTWPQVKGKLNSDGRRSTDDVWYNALPILMGIPPASTYAAWDDDLRRDFYGRRNLIQCPSARFPGEFTRLRHQWVYFSLAMNSQIIVPPNSTTKISEIEGHPDLVLFLDNLLPREKKVDPAQESTELGQPAAFATRLSARHGGSVNLAFPDGRVESFPGRAVVDTRPDSLLRGSVITNGPVLWEP